jgi:hypothetical protein
MEKVELSLHVDISQSYAISQYSSRQLRLFGTIPARSNGSMRTWLLFLARQDGFKNFALRFRLFRWESAFTFPMDTDGILIT